MLPNPVSIDDWIDNYLYKYKLCENENKEKFKEKVNEYLHGKGNFETFAKIEHELFGGNQISQILEIYVKINHEIENLRPFSSLKEISKNELIARFLLCYDNNEYTWREICCKIGYKGKFVATIHTTYTRLFENLRPYSHSEILDSLHLYEKGE